MSKLYETHPQQIECFAEITSIIEKNNHYHLTLDQTLFHPGAEGLPADKGFVEDSKIIDVYLADDVLYHVTDKKPIKIHKAKCRIDGVHRFDFMQQHTAYHLAYEALLELAQTPVVSVHFSQTHCTLEIDRVLSVECLNDVKKHVNAAIASNDAITIQYPTKKELKKLTYRGTLPKSSLPPRLIHIGSNDPIVCEGLHVQSTREIGLFEWLKTEKIKGGMRLSFLAGTRAIRHLQEASQTHQDTVNTLTSTIHTLEAKLRQATQSLADYEAAELLRLAPLYNTVKVISKILPDTSPKALQTLANKLVKEEKVVALLASTQDDLCHLVFMCSNNLPSLNMHVLLQDSITLVDGRGGGSKTVAQGGGKSLNNLDSTLQYALMKVSTLILCS